MGKLLTNEEFIARYPNFELASDYLGKRKPVDVKCKRCGLLKHYNKAAGIKDEIHCDVCDHDIIYPVSHAVPGVNDVYTLRPDLVELFVNPEDAKHICPNSSRKVLLKCLECGTTDLYTIATVSRSGMSCKACSKGRSYPNRLMFNLLKMKLSAFIPEFHPDWAEDRFYDFTFEQNDKLYIVEMDGGFHYGDNTARNVSYEEQKVIDDRKTYLAEIHGYTIIRVDCNYEYHDKFIYIKNSIVNSEIQSLLMWSDEDFNNANLIAQKSDLINICKSYDEGVHDVRKLMDIYGLSYCTIIKKLQNGEKLGICSYVHSEQITQRIANGNIKTTLHCGNPILCIETGEIFYSAACAIRCRGGRILLYLRGECDYAGILNDGTKLHWQLIDKCDIDNYIDDNKYVCYGVDFHRDSETKNIRKYGKVVKCVQTGEYFLNYQPANSKYNTSLSSYFCHNYTYAGKDDDGHKLTWYKPKLNEVLDFIQQGGYIIS